MRRLVIFAATGLGLAGCFGDLHPAAGDVSEDAQPVTDALAVDDEATPADAGSDVALTDDTAADASPVVDATLDAPPTDDVTDDVTDTDAGLDAGPADLGPPPCPEGQERCEGECRSLAEDPMHCGACGVACASGERCEGGACRLVCAMGEGACLGPDGVRRCVSVASDDAHCGACDRPCLDGLRCVSGVCVRVCMGGESVCAVGDAGTRCVNTRSDPMNCGACENACGASRECRDGECRLVCAVGQTDCGAACANLMTDSAHCGACGQACAAGRRCSAGVCVLTCPTGQTACGSSCVNLSTNLSHCGACGRACPSGASSTATCSAGLCGLTCTSSTVGDCDAVASNGCETSLTTVTNCGACGRACAAGQTCTGGVCMSTTRVIDAFDVTTWPRSPWVSVAGGGASSTACAHDGSRGLQDPGWHYRTDVTVGAAGDRLSAWVRFTGSGRVYLGFGASASGAWSLVAAPNTSGLIFQRNASWAYADLATTSFSWSLNTWYRVEVQFNSATSVTGRVYDAAGSQRASVTTTLSGFTRGGVALRAFGGSCVDTLSR